MSARNRNNFWYGLDHIYATCANTVCATARAKLVVASFMPPMVFVRADQRHLNDRVTFRAARHARLVAACFRRLLAAPMPVLAQYWIVVSAFLGFLIWKASSSHRRYVFFPNA